MKVYSIGREAGCDIVINDSTDVISRRHAVLTVASSGKMTITDQSHNGTYVNGIRISPNVPVPVTRKDNVSFAHVARLDWNRVPKSGSPMRYAIYGAIALVAIIGVVVGIKYITKPEPPQPEKVETAAVDSAALKQREKEKSDSIKAAQDKEDSKNKVKEDSTKAKKKNADTKKKPATEKGKTTNNKNKETKCPECGKDIKDCEYKGKHPTVVV